MVVDVLKQMRDRLEAESKINEEDIQAQSDEDTRAYAYKRPIPDDLWIRCAACQGVMFRDEFEAGHQVCSNCNMHYRLDSRTRLADIADAGSFCEWDADMESENPIGFAGYPEKIAQLQQQTGLRDAVITGRAQIDGHPCALGIMDSNFMMGSMGSVVGEKITRLFERATDLRLPVVTFVASGGARMQEGIVSLMQMAKTAAAVGRFQAAGLLYLSVLTDPTTGGVTASFASLGDIILSEPGTLIGFAGRRVIEGTIAQELPAGFQRAEFLLKHGFLDLIVQRKMMKNTLSTLLALHDKPEPIEADHPLSAASIPLPDEGGVNRRSGSERLDLIRQKQRPIITDYLPLIFDDPVELHGDRCFKDDPAMWGGLASLQGLPVTVIGHRKGRTIEENNRANFGMPHPEGYRKAMRLMLQAERFGRPIICLIDTPGAFCGVGAEERGQAEAIANCLQGMMQLQVPILVLVTGEGGSGGALAIGVGDELAMLSNALYSVISPRGFASLLWKDASREREAADILRITAEDLLQLGICDKIVAEPPEGAHTNIPATAKSIRNYLLQALPRLMAVGTEQRLAARYEKFRRIGEFRHADD